jgi:glycosyltransferase involved in cell wall biosynthesis
MRILHVIPSIALADGGPSRAIWQMAESTVETDSNTKVTVFATDHGFDRRRDVTQDEPASSNVKLHLARTSMRFYKVSFHGALWLLRNVRGVDVVHSHALFSFLPVFASLVARWYEIPYVLRPLGTLNAYGLTARRPWAKRLSLLFLELPLIRHAAAVHCTSVAEERDVLAACPTARTVVIPLSVGPAGACSSEAVTAFLGSHHNRPAVLFVARLDPVKNLECLLEAFANIRQRGQDAVLVVAGDGDVCYVQSLRSRSSQLGIDADVLWTGRIDRAQKTAAFAAASVFVLPSHSESFGIAVAEALAAGVPCVLTPGVAIAARVEEAGAGIVAEQNAAPIAEAILNYLQSPELRLRASHAARALAASDYSYDAMGKSLVSLYRSIVLRATDKTKTI